MVEKRLIASFPLNLNNYASDTAMSVLCMKIASDSWLRTAIDKKYEFDFPIVNFPFIFSNSPAAYAYELHSFQLSLWFLSEFVGVGLLLTKNLLNQGLIVSNFHSLELGSLSSAYASDNSFDIFKRFLYYISNWQCLEYIRVLLILSWTTWAKLYIMQSQSKYLPICSVVVSDQVCSISAIYMMNTSLQTIYRVSKR
jgi:hypothetical protein